MTFKNRRGEVPWYVVGLVLAIIVLLVSLFVIPKIRAAQNNATNQGDNICETVLGGKCETGSECTGGATKLPAICPAEKNPDGSTKAARICCKPPD